MSKCEPRLLAKTFVRRAVLSGMVVAGLSAGPTLSTREFFYVGGKYIGPPGKQVMAGQMYVEVLRPQTVTQKYPLVFIHGGSELATNWMSTPYGRTGWADYFLAQGYVVYLVDQPARGRSAWHSNVNGPIGFHGYVPEGGSEASNPQEKKHPQLQAGEKEERKGDPAFDNFYAGLVPQLDDYPELETLTQNAGSALLDKTGPAIVVTHSQSGMFGWLLADSRPKLVKGILAIEPNGPPFDARASYPGNDRKWGLADIPLTYSPPVKEPSELAHVQEAGPDAPGLATCWKQADPPHQLPNLQGIPILIVTSEISPHAAYDVCTSKFLTQAGVKNTHLKLVDHGIYGNHHHMMLERNNLEVAALIQKWVQANIK